MNFLLEWFKNLMALVLVLIAVCLLVGAGIALAINFEGWGGGLLYGFAVLAFLAALAGQMGR